MPFTVAKGGSVMPYVPLWVDYVLGVRTRFIWLGEHTLICSERYNREHIEPIEDEI